MKAKENLWNISVRHCWADPEQNTAAENVAHIVCYNGQIRVTVVYFHTKKTLKTKKKNIPKKIPLYTGKY